MATLFVRHTVEDYGKWKTSFDEHSSFRSDNGSKGGKVFRSVNDPNELFVLLEWESVEGIQKFSQSDDLKKVMKEAGVIGMPDIHILEEVSTTSK